MEVIEAKSAGFCFGVARAVKIAQELADSAQTPRMLGSVIHNQRVTEDLARQGMTGPETRFCSGPTALGGRSTRTSRPGAPALWTPPAPRWPTSSSLSARRRRRAASR